MSAFDAAADEFHKLHTILSDNSEIFVRLDRQKSFGSSRNTRSDLTPRELALWMDSYPGHSSRDHGGFLPLSATSQTTGVNVRSSVEWRGSKYVWPRANPCFRELMSQQRVAEEAARGESFVPPPTVYSSSPYEDFYRAYPPCRISRCADST